MEQLGFHWPSLLVYLVNFSILLVVLYAVGYKPILRILDQRAERIQNSLEEAERIKTESEERQEEMRRELEQARQEGQAMISQSRDLATKFKEEEREKAAGEAEGFLSKARGDIERDRDNSMEDLRGQFAGLAISAAEKVIERSLDEKAHREIIERVLDETSQVPGDK